MDGYLTGSRLPPMNPTNTTIPKVLATLGLLASWWIPPLGLALALIARHLARKANYKNVLVTVSVWVNGVMTVVMAIAIYFLIKMYAS